MPIEQDSSATTPVGSLPPAFPDVGALLWRRNLWQAWLEEHPEEADLLANSYGCLVRLTSHTGWNEDRTLERLGCEASSDEELRKLATERLGLCNEYFEWVEGLLLNLDLVSDKRLMVSGAARIFAAAEKDLGLCKRIMTSGIFPPLEYLCLGEIAQSWQSAIRALPGRRGDLARETYADNPFVDQSSPHLSPRRLDMLDRPNAQELLGPRIQRLMRGHLEVCAVCAESHDRRGHEPAISQQPPRVRVLA
jgi:hypothetical protein